MVTREKDITGVLIQIAGDIGQTREGIVNLKNGYETIVTDIRTIKDSLVNTVTVAGCQARHEQVATSITNMKRDLVTEIRNNPSGEVGAAEQRADERETDLADRQRDRTRYLEDKIEEVEERRVEKRRKSMTYWLTAIGAVVGFVGTVSVGAWKLVSITKEVNDTLVQTRKQLVDGNTKPRIIYVDVPRPVDAGPEPIIVPSKRNRSARTLP